MAEEPENLVLSILREMRPDMKPDFARLDETLLDVRRHVVSLDMRVEALGTSAIGFAANASRAHVDLHKQIAGPACRVEKLERTK